MKRRHEIPTRYRLKILLVTVVTALSASTPPTAHADWIKPDDPNIQYRGRWDFSNSQAPRTGWPGTSLIATFQGSSIQGAFVDDNGASRILVKIDEQPVNTIQLADHRTGYTLAHGLADTNHTIEIIKMTEGCCGDRNCTFLGFELDANRHLLSPPPRPSLKLDFYGDSFAAGYSDECLCNSGEPQYKNADHAFPALTARLLHAEYQSQSWSGIGLSRGYEALTMPQVYNRTLPTYSSPTWDFARFQPDCVVIELGDNDIENGASPEQVKAAMENFVRNDIRSVYPKTPIVLMETYGLEARETSTFISEIAGDLEKTGDSNVSILRSPGAKLRGPGFMGVPWLSGEHPVYCQHVGYANLLAAHIATLLKLPTPAPLPMSCLPEPGTIVNGGFELATLPDANAADGWRPIPGKGAVLRVSGSDAHSGTNYLQLDSKAGTAGVFQPTDAYPHQRYHATAYLKSPSGTGTGKLSIEFRDRTQKRIASESTLAQLTSQWRTVAVSGQAPDQTWQIRVVCVSDTGFKVDFDDVTLEAR